MKARALLNLSARSVGRNVRRSALTAAAMALGLALLIFSRGLAEGGHEQWIDSAVRLGSGHVAVQAPNYLETNRLEHHLNAEQAGRVTAALAAPSVEDRILRWTPRLSVTGLASSAASALPVRIEGVDPGREPAFSELEKYITLGRYLEHGDRLHAFVGSEFARRLELDVGSRFVLTAQGATGEIESQLMRVAGIFSTGVKEMDESFLHVPIETARAWLQAPGAVTTVAVLLPSSRATDATVAALDAELDGADGIRVLGWRQASPDLDSAVRIDDYGDYVFHVILFAIVALAILNSVMMSVLGRRREFGILQAIGLTGPETGLVVFGEGLFLTAASGLVGMIVGFIVTWGVFGDGIDFSAMMENEMELGGGVIDPVIVPAFHFDAVLLSLFFIVLIGTLASLYPAFRASRLDVAEAMKFEQ
jgi:ABC-type lipoprotein release transport system permease subunit